MGLTRNVRLTTPLRALIVEDCEADAELLLHELAHGGYDVTAARVQTEEALRSALQRDSWQVVLSDYSMPAFSGIAALAIVREVRPDLPFIIVSGTIGEETAVEALKAGACDFLIKARLARLIPALARELRDVDVRRERLRAQAVLEEQLRQSQKMEGIGRLAGGIAHDFNNILTAIIGFSEMVLDQIGLDKPISHDLQEIRNAADRAAALTRQLLAFSRQQTLHIAAVDLNQVILHASDMLQRLIGEDIQVRVHLIPQVRPILADPTQLEQILMNLSTNARDAMPRGGSLRIETTIAGADDAVRVPQLAGDSGRYVKLSVIDTGVGMDAATQARMFEPFFTTKPVGQGTGLGLSTVYGVVQQLGGYIDVLSELERGTTFSVYFAESAAKVVAPEPARPRLTEAPAAQAGEVVLLVEDEDSVRRLAARVLDRHGYTVLEADGAARAIALVEQHGGTISLIVSDVVMPAMDGPAMIACVRKTHPDLKVLYVSGYTGEALMRRGGLEAGARVLEKPFSAAGLLQAVRDVLDGR